MLDTRLRGEERAVERGWDGIGMGSGGLFWRWVDDGGVLGG